MVGQARDGAAQIAAAVKPKLRGWLHAGMSPIALAAGIVLVALSPTTTARWTTAVFAASSVLLFTTSAVYHRGTWTPKVTGVLRRLDHSNIFAIIAGTYTPFTLVSLRGALGWWMFGAVWTLAALGIAKELIWGRRWPSVPIYLLMGWLGVVALVPLVRQLHLDGALWLLAGGVLYTVGVIFYAKDDEWPHAHGIWHLFVLGGTASHVVTVMYFVR